MPRPKPFSRSVELGVSYIAPQSAQRPHMGPLHRNRIGGDSKAYSNTLAEKMQSYSLVRVTPRFLESQQGPSQAGSPGFS
ncbi:hypothetical protein DL771_008337 [Monosporascus sp. 5C6A]|nr:hypothetical protein DL771_008337 [Monosporascus sp. 5C6A]